MFVRVCVCSCLSVWSVVLCSFRDVILVIERVANKNPVQSNEFLSRSFHPPSPYSKMIYIFNNHWRRRRKKIKSILFTTDVCRKNLKKRTFNRFITVLTFTSFFYFLLKKRRRNFQSTNRFFFSLSNLHFLLPRSRMQQIESNECKFFLLWLINFEIKQTIKR